MHTVPWSTFSSNPVSLASVCSQPSSDNWDIEGNAQSKHGAHNRLRLGVAGHATYKASVDFYLASLQSFPFDKIKIDRSFVSGMTSNAQSEAIVRTVLGLGVALDIPVIAEGVETDAERLLLKRHGCTEIQGYLIGRPMEISQFATLTGAPPSPGALHSIARA